MSEEFERWMNIYKWRGEQIQAIKAINQELKEIKEEIRYIRRCNNQRDIRTATIAGTVSILTAIIIAVISRGLIG